MGDGVRQTPAQRQATYRKRHPERVKTARLARRPLDRITDAEYRARVGTHPMNKPGTDEYKAYRSSEQYKLSYINGHLKRKYGITFEQYQKMFDKQNGECRICKGTTPNRNWKDGRTQYMKLFVDHDHKTGRVRGLLCNTCNQGIAALKENVDILKSAIEYLTESAKEVSRP